MDLNPPMTVTRRIRRRGATVLLSGPVIDRA
jgi:hypothetical protein